MQPQIYSPEPVIHQDHIALVTPSRVQILGKTYPLQGLTAVEITRKPPPILAVLFGVLVCAAGIVLALLGVVMVVQQGNPVALVLGGIGALVGSAVVRGAKPTYALVLHTAGMQTRAITATTREPVERLAAAINAALAHRR